MKEVLHQHQDRNYLHFGSLQPRGKNIPATILGERKFKTETCPFPTSYARNLRNPKLEATLSGKLILRKGSLLGTGGIGKQFLLYDEHFFL